jgi:hypothetical protein
MVKLEQWHSAGGNGKGMVSGIVYVRPEDVISIQTSVYGDATTVRTGVSENSWVVVKGTPDEVHAKLFPPPSGPDFNVARDAKWSDVEQVLDWAAGGFNAPCPTVITALARKALGRDA